MGKAGRKRKAGSREPNGQLRRPSAEQRRAAERANRLGATRFVADQPHRKGNDHPMAGSVFGRFCLANKLPREVYDAGQDYGRLVAQWRASRCIPVTRNATPGPTPHVRSEEDERRRSDKLRLRMTDADRALMGQGSEAFIAVRQLLVDEYELHYGQDAHAIMGLNALALHLGFLGRHPFEAGR